MGFQDVVFLPLQTGIYTTFIRHCGRGFFFWTATCLRTVVCKQGHALCKIFLLQQIIFLCQLNFLKIIRLSQH